MMAKQGFTYVYKTCSKDLKSSTGLWQQTTYKKGFLNALYYKLEIRYIKMSTLWWLAKTQAKGMRKTQG